MALVDVPYEFMVYEMVYGMVYNIVYGMAYGIVYGIRTIWRTQLILNNLFSSIALPSSPFLFLLPLLVKEATDDETRLV